jgi:myosin-1
LPQCRALYDYEAQEADELALTTGQIVTIIKKNDDGWWLGTLNGKRGVFPGNYVEEIK